MSDTNDRENLEEQQSAQDAAPEQVPEAAPAAPEENNARGSQGSWELEVTAVQFPRIDLEDVEQPAGAQNAIPDIPLEDEELPSLEDDKPEDRGKLYDFIARMDDKQFRRAQMIFGCVIGALGAAALAFPVGSDTNASLWTLVIALFIVMWLPGFVERKTDKKMPVARKWMLIVFAAAMLIFIGVNALNGVYSPQSSATANPSPSVAPSATPAP